MSEEAAFFTVHSDLPREGPGLAEDVKWALELAATPQVARLCDAACGPGADTVTLAQERPKAQVDAVELHDGFVAAAKARTQNFGDRVSVELRDYTDLQHDYDLIWCAGAAYFVGYLNALEVWKPHLRHNGAVAFSEPVRVTEPASSKALTFWDDYTPLRSVAEIEAELRAAKWTVLGHRLIIGSAWSAYYDPLRARLDALQSQSPDASLKAAMDEAALEIDRWDACADEIAYGLFVVRPQ